MAYLRKACEQLLIQRSTRRAFHVLKHRPGLSIIVPRFRVAEPPPHTASDEAGYLRTLKFGGQQMYPRAMEPCRWTKNILTIHFMGKKKNVDKSGTRLSFC
jgi:hypothetical protein